MNKLALFELATNLVDEAYLTKRDLIEIFKEDKSTDEHAKLLNNLRRLVNRGAGQERSFTRESLIEIVENTLTGKAERERWKNERKLMERKAKNRKPLGSNQERMRNLLRAKYRRDAARWALVEDFVLAQDPPILPASVLESIEQEKVYEQLEE